MGSEFWHINLPLSPGQLGWLHLLTCNSTASEHQRCRAVYRRPTAQCAVLGACLGAGARRDLVDSVADEHKLPARLKFRDNRRGAIRGEASRDEAPFELVE